MGYWSNDMEWIEEDDEPQRDYLTWKTLISKLQEYSEEELNETVAITDSGGADVFGIELKKHDRCGLYIKGE